MGMKLGLENVRMLLKRIGNPERSFPSVHVAGTNGKGSTVAILESVLRTAGYKTGRFTSPHLIDMRERIQISGKEITEHEVVECIQFLKPHIEVTHATFFEVLTAMAFRHFSMQNVDIAILETGLGGRLDATNLVTPQLTIITEIGRDHTKILGKSIEAIAREKAGMLKPGIPCVCGATRQIARDFFRTFASEQHIPLTLARESTRVSDIRLSEAGTDFNCRTERFFYKDLHCNLLGRHQVDNAILAILATEELDRQGFAVPERAIQKGLENVSWPARLDLLQEKPKILLDSAHNPMGASRLVDALKNIFDYKRLILLFGVLRDKDYRSMMNRLAPLADRLVLTQPLSHRALEPERLMRLQSVQSTSVEAIPDITKAWNRAISFARENDLVCAAGSIYLVGDLLRLWKNS